MVDNSVYRRIFSWLFVGLLITFGGGYALSLNEVWADKVLALGILPIIAIELVIAFLMGLRIRKMHPFTAKIFYIIYCITTGITFSAIFMTYELNSLMFIFLITALIFGVLALWGHNTKRDLSKFGHILVISLLIVIVFDILNIFLFKSSITDVVLSSLCILIFCGFIAYDMNKVKLLVNAIGEEKAGIYGAFELYLDFINLFMRLVQLFGKRDN